MWLVVGPRLPRQLPLVPFHRSTPRPTATSVNFQSFDLIPLPLEGRNMGRAQCVFRISHRQNNVEMRSCRAMHIGIRRRISKDTP